MPIDFRTYTDPGVFVEETSPPVVFNPAIEPTILAIVGEAPTARSVTESAVLSASAATSFTTEGVDPSTVNVVDRLLGTQFVSAAFGQIVADITNASTSFAVEVFDGINIPSTPFTILVDDEQMSVTNIVGSTYTVTRAQNATVAVSHDADAVVNFVETYSATASIKVASFATPVSSTDTTVAVTPTPVVQKVYNDGTGGTFTLTYDGQTTSAIAYNASASTVTTALEALSNIAVGDVSVTGAGTSGNPWIITFKANLADNTVALTANDASMTGKTIGTTITNRGVLVNTYLDVEGERLQVTAAPAPSLNRQSLTVVRGVNGTTAKPHGAVDVYQNTGADYQVVLGDAGVMSLVILDTTRIGNGATVTATFKVTDDAQFSPALFDDMDTVKDKYGPPFLGGTVYSELALGAQLAFANGATRVVLVAANPDDDNPIQDAIEKLAYEPSVNTIALLSGSSSDVDYLRGHVDQQSERGQLRRAFVGLDGTAVPPPNSSTFITRANQLHDQRVALVAPAQFEIDNGTDTALIIPGYFAAAAVAGIHAGRLPQEPLTRKQVYGFLGIKDQDTTTNVLQMQANGVLVVFEDRFGRLIIKHGLTTDTTNLYTKEISVGAARDRLRDLVLETLEQGDLIGSAMTTSTPNLVMAGVVAALEESVRQGLIYGYSDVKFRIPDTDPTSIEVRFAYKPTLPLNYILVQFVIDTSAGTALFQSINEEAPIA